MHRNTIRSMALALSLVSLAAQAQSELQRYVQRCQSELGFSASEVIARSCRDHGVNFANNRPTPIFDFLVYHKVNDNVDMTAACRWGNFNQNPEAQNFASVEMFIHNRQTGGTCYFSARDADNGDTDKIRNVSHLMPAVTQFPAADAYWLAPSELNSKLVHTNDEDVIGDADVMKPLQCVQCHSAGAYIATTRIAPHLATYGLLNNGHDTFVNMSGSNYYHAVGSAHYTRGDDGSHPFAGWNKIINDNNAHDCSSSCHILALKSSINAVHPPGDSTTLLPPIKKVIALIGNAMAPNNFDEANPSAYRWINRDTAADGVDIETFTSSKPRFGVLGTCGSPGYVEAHAVGSQLDFNSKDMALIPDKLRFFNVREGLQCLNSDQPGGRRCYDYRVSYKCPVGSTQDWTPFYNSDTVNNDDGEHEEKSRHLQAATAFCGSAPIGIRTEPVSGGLAVARVVGPNDRLAQLSPSGLVCRDSDQPNGARCSNYVARYRDCSTNAAARMARMKNAWVNLPTFGDRFLTTTNNVNGAETRAQGGNFQYPSQDWIIEAVPGGNTYRLKDVWSGKYLTASGNNDQATVLVNDSNTSLMRQQWLIEDIANSSEKRLKNVGSQRYLTVGNYSGDPYYAPILSQSLSNQNWASQRWLIQ